MGGSQTHWGGACVLSSPQLAFWAEVPLTVGLRTGLSPLLLSVGAGHLLSARKTVYCSKDAGPVFPLHWELTVNPYCELASHVDCDITLCVVL
jgi:hypothetical protein